MVEIGKYTLSEINSQPEIWKEVLSQIQESKNLLADFFNEGDYQQILFTGCGSTFYASIAGASIFQNLLKINSKGLPASEIWLSEKSNYVSNARTLLIAVSRSGETTETVNACKKFKAENSGDVLTLSCYPHGELSKCGDLNLTFPSAMEKSIAQTRAFSSLYLSLLAIAVNLTKNQELLSQLSLIPKFGASVLTKNERIIDQIGSSKKYENVIYLGSGLRYGLACELSLKMKEISLTVSEPFHFLEFRHGPMSMVTDNTLIIGLTSTSYQPNELSVIKDMVKRGASSLSIGNNGTDICFNTSIAEVLQGALYLPLGQVLAVKRAFKFGINPDKPKNLDAVIKLEEVNV